MTLNKTISETQQLDQDKVITFPNGVPGFQDCTQFTLSMKQDSPGSTIYWLESLDDPATSFSLVDPVAFGLNYQLTLSDQETETLKAENADDIVVLLMISKKDATDGDLVNEIPLHANIKGPLVINTASRLGIQKVLGKPGISVNIQE